MGIIETAYEKVNNLPVSEGLLALSSIICAIIIIYKLIKAVQDSSQEGQIDIKSFFRLFHSYIYMLVAIILAPATFTMIETALGAMSDDLTGFHQGVLNDDAWTMVTKYIEEMDKEYEEAGMFEAAILSIFSEIRVIFYTIIVYIEKLIYSIFMSSRYLYLIILKIATPIAIVCSLHESTMDITKTYLRNLFNCYIMLPCFLIANNFAEALVETIASGVWATSKYDVPMLLIRIFLKLFLFGKAFQYAKQII